MCRSQGLEVGEGDSVDELRAFLPDPQLHRRLRESELQLLALVAQHADPSVTLRVYAHVIRRHAAGIADVFAAAADQVDEDQDDEEDGPDSSGLVPC